MVERMRHMMNNRKVISSYKPISNLELTYTCRTTLTVIFPEKVIMNADLGCDVALFFFETVKVKFVRPNGEEFLRGKWCNICK